MFAIIALTAVAMRFRNATIRQLKIADHTTTVLTLTGLGADSGAGGNPNWGRRVAAVVTIFLAGALILFGTIACTLHPAAARPAI